MRNSIKKLDFKVDAKEKYWEKEKIKKLDTAENNSIIITRRGSSLTKSSRIGSLKKINVNCNLKDSQDSKKISITEYMSPTLSNEVKKLPYNLSKERRSSAFNNKRL